MNHVPKIEIIPATKRKGDYFVPQANLYLPFFTANCSRTMEFSLIVAVHVPDNIKK